METQAPPSFVAVKDMKTMGKTMGKTIPSRDDLKQEAARLRAKFMRQGRRISHSESLEHVAHRWGARDWNTLSAAAPTPENPPRHHPRWQIGQRIGGRYLGQVFEGQIKAANQQHGGFWQLTLVFDHPVDVVTSNHFSNFRKQVNCTINSQGVSPARTSNGDPQMRIRPT